MKGYLAGPMRGIEHFNFPAFDAAAAELRRQGHEVLNPAEHDRESGFDETLNRLDGFDMKKAILWDLEAICQSQCVWLLPGWERSTGCEVEVALARFLGLPLIVAPVPTEVAS